MKKKLVQWLYNYLQPKYKTWQKEKINLFRTTFRIHFEDYNNFEGGSINVFNSLQITNLEYKFIGLYLIVTVTLGRQGLLIGKGERTINRLNKYLSDYNMSVEIKESKLWRTLK